MQIQLLNPLLFEWLDETGCDRRNSLRRKAYGLHGSPPIGVSSVLRKRVFQQCQLMGLTSTQMTHAFQEFQSL